MELLHWAYCLETGEIIGSCRVNELKRRIRYSQAWDFAHGYGGKRSWRFHHGEYETLRIKGC